MNHNTSLFAEILKLIPRSEFNRIVRRHGGERNAKGFTYRDLNEWLEDPFTVPLQPPETDQLTMAF